MDLSFLTKIFRFDWITLPLFGIATFFIVYFWADKILIKIHSKSLSKRSDILMHMKLLGMHSNATPFKFWIRIHIFFIGVA